jgi:hypothetical protein
LLICSNLMHRVADDVQDAVDIPLLRITDAIASRARTDGHTRLGVLGTHWTMEEDFYAGRLARAAVRHPDLNVTNLLVPREDEEPRIVLLDLDRCRVHDAPLPDDGRRMVRRLARSLRRGEERRGPVLDRDEWDAFSQGATRAG